MEKLFISFLFLAIFSSSLMANERQSFLKAFEKELNNRVLATEVVTTLAGYYKGTPQGKFWAAYATLEQYQMPFYHVYGKCFDVPVARLSVWIKSWFSIIFAKVFPERFIVILEGSTRSYLASLKSINVPENYNDQRLWSYFIDQEQVQVDAFEQARVGNYKLAAKVIERFVEREPLPISPGDCQSLQV